MSVTRYRKAILSVPKLYANDVEVKAAGSLRLMIGANIKDALANVLIAPDGAGAITTLANVISATTFNSEKVITPPLYGVANKDYVPCFYIGDIINSGQVFESTTYSISNAAAATAKWMFGLPLPTALYGKKLYVKNLLVNLMDADVSDYITTARVMGLSYASQTVLNEDLTDITAVTAKIYTFSAVDASSYDLVVVTLDLTCPNDATVDINTVAVEVYYDT